MARARRRGRAHAPEGQGPDAFALRDPARRQSRRRRRRAGGPGPGLRRPSRPLGHCRSAPTTTTSSATQAANDLAESAQLDASATVFDGGRTSELVKKYGYATEAARESLRSTRISLVGQADAAFFAVLEAEASVDAATSDLEAAKARQDIAQAKIDAGSLSKSAYLQTEADTAGYETTLVLAKKTLASAKAKLSSLTGAARCRPLSRRSISRATTACSPSFRPSTRPASTNSRPRSLPSPRPTAPPSPSMPSRAGRRNWPWR